MPTHRKRATTIKKATDKETGTYTAEDSLSKLWKSFSETVSVRATPNITFHEPSRRISDIYSELKIKNEISKLEQKAETLSKELAQAIIDQNAADAQKEQEFNNVIEEIKSKQKLEHLLRCISPGAHEAIELNDDFRANFDTGNEVEAFVVSIDIRRSTELMLKAKTASAFADFITKLCSDFDSIIKDNYGVVDKFTGDGILAYFPKFFSGPDAGFYALKASQEAHRLFEERYKEYRSSFSTVLKSVGLGIGIDYGNVHLLNIAGALTVVGQPVVYACRMGGAPAGETYLNQPAFEEVTEKYAGVTTIEETTITIKAEGELLAYSAKLNGKHIKIQAPEWIQ